MPILDTVEHSLKHFRPKNHRQFVLLTIARRFDDVSNLARYLNLSDAHPKKVLLEAARIAEQRALEDGRPASTWFFDLLEDWRQREEP